MTPIGIVQIAPSQNSVNTVKSRFDKYWIDKDVVYDCKSERTGDSTSLCVMLFYLRHHIGVDCGICIVQEAF